VSTGLQAHPHKNGSGRPTTPSQCLWKKGEERKRGGVLVSSWSPGDGDTWWSCDLPVARGHPGELNASISSSRVTPRFSAAALKSGGPPAVTFIASSICCWVTPSFAAASARTVAFITGWCLSPACGIPCGHSVGIPPPTVAQLHMYSPGYLQEAMHSSSPDQPATRVWVSWSPQARVGRPCCSQQDPRCLCTHPGYKNRHNEGGRDYQSTNCIVHNNPLEKFPDPMGCSVI